MIRYYMGIDPGKTGGLAVINNIGHVYMTVPFTKKTEMDICTYIININVIVTRCGLEKVHSMPKQGVKSSFTFGEGYGLLKGALYGSKTSFELITPQKWQKHLGCLTKSDKNVSKQKAQQLFPDIDMTHYIADALLIAEYMRQTENNRI